MAKDLKVRITGDASSYERALKHSESHTRKFGRALGDMGKIAGGILLSKGLEQVAIGIHGTIKAAEESEKVQAQLEQQLKASGESYDKFGGQIEQTVSHLSQLAGLDDEDLASAFIRLDRASGDAQASMDQLGLVADIARARNIDVAKAADLVAKAMDGNTNAFKRYGVTVEKGASVQETLAAAQAKFAGQAEAYGKTAAGAHDRQRVALENLQESIGAKLLPIWNNMLNWAATQLPKIADFFDRHSEDINRVLKAVGSFINNVLIPIFKEIGETARLYWGMVAKVFRDNREDIMNVINGVRAGIEATAKVIQFLAEKVVIPVLKPLLMTVLPAAFKVTIATVSALVDAISGIISGFRWIGTNAAEIWRGVADKLAGPLGALRGFLEGVAGVLRSIVGNMNNIINLADKVASAVSKVSGFVGGVVGKLTGRAAGGPVTAGVPHIVGENGPEVFIPSTNGQIVSNSDAFGGGGVAVAGGGNIFITLELDGQTLWSGVRKYGMKDSRYIATSTAGTNGGLRGALV